MVDAQNIQRQMGNLGMAPNPVDVFGHDFKQEIRSVTQSFLGSIASALGIKTESKKLMQSLADVSTAVDNGLPKFWSWR